ncbi:MAG: hypothetical protein IPM25_00960 [Chloracidobacterium sp.]|nr:hypothetical protein [Chloracidobacterium sp.]
MTRKSLKLTAALMLCLAGLACSSGPGEPTNTTAAAVFSADSVCRYPLAAPGRYFTYLGAGIWQPSESGRQDSPYSCGPGKASVKIHEDASGTIEVEFSASGDQKGAQIINLNYTVVGVRSIPNESTLRRMFSNLADTIAKEGLGQPMPEFFHKRVANLNSYSKPGKASAEPYDVGSGFVTLERQATDDRLGIEIYVKFYPDAAYKLK